MIKKITILFLIVCVGFTAKAQFPTTDSLRNYIDRYIRSSAVEAFQNLRMNTALKGLASQIDSVAATVTGGARVVDTIYAINDTTLAYRIRGTIYQVGIQTGAGGGGSSSVSHDNTLVGNGNTTPLKVDTSRIATRHAVTALARLAFTEGAGIDITGDGVVSSTITQADGSETIIQLGQGMQSVTGIGTVASPYTLNVKTFADSIWLKPGTDSVFNVVGGVPRYAFLIPGAGTPGVVESATSLGSGSAVYKQKTGTELEFRSLVNNTTTTLTTGTNDITIGVNTTNIPTVTRMNDSLSAHMTLINGRALTSHTHAGADITQSSSYRFVTDAEKATWNGKQDALGYTPVPTTRTVNGHALSGNVTITKGDVGLGNADNTSDANKPVSTAQAAAIALKDNILTFSAPLVRTTNTISVDTTSATGLATQYDIAQILGGAADNWGTQVVIHDATLSGQGITGNTLKVDTSVISTKANVTDQLQSKAALSHNHNDIYYTETEINTSLALKADASHTHTKSQVGLSNVDNTSDASKPISTLTQAALDLKSNTSHNHVLDNLSNVTTTGKATGDLLRWNGTAWEDFTPNYLTSVSETDPTFPSGGTSSQVFLGNKTLATANKTLVGLPNVDNTSDANKPVSTAQAAALALKANTSALGAVAFSNSYNDLSDKPTIPTNNNTLTNGAGYVTGARLADSTAVLRGLIATGGTSDDEVDPTVSETVKAITSGDVTNWNSKQAAITTGTTAQYLRGDLSLATFPTNLVQTTSSYSNPAWITALSWTKITDRATTLSGYGITDAATSTHNHALDNLSNVTTTGKASGDLLRWNGSAWEDWTPNYLTSLSETDPTVAAHIKAITTDNVANWTTAYNRGDHATQGYLTQTTGDARYSLLGHSHAIADITNLQTTLDAKAASTHNHSLDNLSNVVTTGKATGDLIRWNGSAWEDFTPNYLTTYSETDPSIPVGTSSQVILGNKTLGTLNGALVGLGNVNNTSDANKPVSIAQQAALDLKSNTSHNHTLQGLSNVDPTGLGTGEVLQYNGSTWVPYEAFNASNLTTGTLPTARIASSSISVTQLSATGTKDATTVLYGDNVFRTAPTGTTNLTKFNTAEELTIFSSTGTDVVLEGATSIASGLLTAADKIKLDGGVQTAGSGIFKTGTAVDVGGPMGTTAGALSRHTDLPLQTYEFRIRQNNTSGFMNMVGGGNNLAGAILRFNDTLTVSSSDFKGRHWLRFEPLTKGQGSAPFIFNQSVQHYAGSAKPNEVMMFGWNINTGGGALVAGEPGIGISMEQDYRPSPGASLTEFHDFWIKPNGTQVRLKSYTIDNNSENIDFYHTVNKFYLRHHNNVNYIYASIYADTALNETVMQLSGNYATNRFYNLDGTFKDFYRDGSRGGLFYSSQSITYDGDYTATFTGNSLVTVDWVNAAIAAAGSDVVPGGSAGSIQLNDGNGVFTGNTSLVYYGVNSRIQNENTAWQSHSVANATLGSNTYLNDEQTFYVRAATGPASWIQFSNGNFYLRNAASGTGGSNITSLNEILFGNTDGNVGIGTTSVSTEKLTVAGVIYSTTGGIKFPDGTTQTTAASGGSSQWTTVGEGIHYSSGNVGIGISAPTELLYLKKDQAASTGFKVENLSTNAAGSADAVFANNEGLMSMGVLNANKSAYGILSASTAYKYSNLANGMSFMADNATGVIRFATGGPSEKLRIRGEGVLRYAGDYTASMTDDNDVPSVGWVNDAIAAIGGGGGLATDNFYTGGVIPGFKIQSATTNARTFLGIVPNGTSNLADISLWASSDITTNWSSLFMGHEGGSNSWAFNSLKGGTETLRQFYFNATGNGTAGTANIIFKTDGAVTLPYLSGGGNQALGVNNAGDIIIMSGGGTGTVTSVGLSLPNIFSVSNSPVTTNGTLTATLANQTANKVFASPNGSTGAPTFRALTKADMGVLEYTASTSTSGLTTIATISTGIDGTIPESGVYEIVFIADNAAAGIDDTYYSTIRVHYSNPTGAAVTVKEIQIIGSVYKDGLLSSASTNVISVGRNLVVSVNGGATTAINWKATVENKNQHLTDL